MKYAKLSDIAEIQIGKTPKRSEQRYWGNGFPWLSISDMKTEIITKTKEQITEEAVIESGCKLIKKGTLLMSFKLSVGKLAFAGTDLYTNEAICGFILKKPKNVNTKYLYYALKNTKMTGSNIAAKGITLNSNSLRNLQIPFYEKINYQDHIADFLTKAENLIIQRKESINLLDELLKSTFLEMFGINYEKEKKWAFEYFGNYINVLTDYHSNGSYESLRDVVTLKKEEDYALMVRTTDLENTNFSGDCNYIDEFAYNFLKKSKVYGGEIIINKIGSAGKVYLMPHLNRPISLGMNSFLLRFNNQLNNIFIYYLLNTEYGEKTIQKNVKGAVTKTITKDAIRSIKIPIPPIELQNKFATIVEKVEILKKKYQASFKELENMYGVLSQKAFKGEFNIK